MGADKPWKAGVIGAGTFGTTIANLLGINGEVLLFSRSRDKAGRINRERWNLDIPVHPNVIVSSDPAEICSHCRVIFPIVPSANFAEIIRRFAPFLKPSHILIHGTKGLDLRGLTEDEILHSHISRAMVRTMSEVVLEETNVVRVGCLSGPNLATEIQQGQPTATVVASQFDEVIEVGQRLLSSKLFFVFGSHDLLGAELSGAFKNIIAIGSGILSGLGMGKNIQAMLIVRSLREIIYLGKALGSTSKAFLGTAGIGDIIATSMSPDSRNFQVGQQLSAGKSLADIEGELTEVAEGIRTLKIAYHISDHYNVHCPIIGRLYEVVFEDYDIERAIQFLMRYPYTSDVDFL